MIEAIKQNGNPLLWAAPKLLADSEFRLEAAKHRYTANGIKHAAPELLKDCEFMLELGAVK